MRPEELKDLVKAAQAYRESKERARAGRFAVILEAVAAAYGFQTAELKTQTSGRKPILERRMAARAVAVRLGEGAGVSQAEMAVELGGNRSNLSHLAHHMEMWMEAFEIFTALEGQISQKGTK